MTNAGAQVRHVVSRPRCAKREALGQAADVATAATHTCCLPQDIDHTAKASPIRLALPVWWCFTPQHPATRRQQHRAGLAWGMVGQEEYVLMASRRPGLYTSSSTLTTSKSAPVCSAAAGHAWARNC